MLSVDLDFIIRLAMELQHGSSILFLLSVLCALSPIQVLTSPNPV
jgi:hypothetical protein